MVVLARCLSVALIVVALAILHGTGLRVRMPASLAEWRCLTALVCGSLFVSSLAYTAFARVFGGNEATVSACLLDWSQQWPVIPAVVFFLLGHIFFPVWNR